MVGVRGLTLQLPGNHAVGWGYLLGTGSQAWNLAGGRGRKMRGSTGREEKEQASGREEEAGMLKQGSKGLTSLPPSFCCVLPSFPLSPLSAPLHSKNLRFLAGAPVCNPNTGLGIPIDSCMCVYVCSESRLQ